MTMGGAVANLIGTVGRKVTLKVIEGMYDPATGQRTITTPPEYPAMASVRRYTAAELVGDIQQGDQEVRIAGQALMDGDGAKIIPKDGDKIVMSDGETTVLEVNTRVVRDDPVLHIIRVRG